MRVRVERGPTRGAHRCRRIALQDCGAIGFRTGAGRHGLRRRGAGFPERSRAVCETPPCRWMGAGAGAADARALLAGTARMCLCCARGMAGCLWQAKRSLAGTTVTARADKSRQKRLSVRLWVHSAASRRPGGVRWRRGPQRARTACARCGFGQHMCAGATDQIKLERLWARRRAAQALAFADGRTGAGSTPPCPCGGRRRQHLVRPSAQTRAAAPPAGGTDGPAALRYTRGL